jgi:3-hydroxyacyl-[acyl-carrier-protein] dehydratase
VTPIDLDAVVAGMPLRYDRVLVDRVLACTPGVSIRGVKSVTINEPYFAGHFPAYPVMPGVLIIEALTQLSGALAAAGGHLGPDGRLALDFTGIDECRFKRQVVPGDTLTLESDWQGGADGTVRFAVRALVDEQLAAEAILLAAIRGA